MELLLLFFLLYLKHAAMNVFHETTAAFPTTGCCYEKQVGTERYVLVSEDDTTTAHNDCNSNCVYEKKTAPSSRYCFKAGNDQFHCRAEQEPIRSILPIIEGNESFVQENIFQNETGVLVLKVPAHKDYTESVFVFEQKTGTSLLKTGDVCQLADLPTYFNVSASAERYESKATMNQSEKVTSFILKTRDSRLGSRRRAELVADVQDLCNNVPLVKSKDFSVNETEFEKFKNGEVIFIERRSTRKCLMKESCTKVEPNACGYGWVNPAGKGLSFHEVSAGSICVTCNMNFTKGPANQDCDRTLCNCTEIKNKNSLVDCSIKSKVNSNIEIERWNDTTTRQQQQPILTQSMVYNRNYERRSITISSPAHKDIGALEVVMHAHKDGWWHNGIYNNNGENGDSLENNQMMKLGNTCFISTLNASVFPVDIAIGIQEIKKGNDVTTADDELDTHAILRDLGPLTAEEETGLHEDIQSRCLDSNLKNNVEIPITKIQSDDLKNGKIIFMGSVPSRSYCQLQTAVANNNTGCWRFPNPHNKSSILWVHQIIHSVTEVPCCLTQTEIEFSTCCQDNHPKYRECKDIMAAWNSALFVSSGYDSATLSSVEILQEGIDGTYASKQVVINGGCSAPPDLPLATSSATGSLFNGVPHVCVGYKDGEPSAKCFGLQSDGSWENGFNLTKPLKDGGSSVTFGAWKGVSTPWWIVGGEPSGVGTEVWGGDPPAEIFNITLPAIIHTPCMAKINEYEAFVTAIPKPDSDSSNFAWIFNIQTNNWTRLQDTIKKRVGPACGVLKNVTGKYVVLAGGWESSTTEIFNLETKIWTMGPSLGVDTYGGSMVSVSDGQELLLVGGYSTAPLSDIRKLGPSMSSWETVGQLDKARYDAVALGVPVGDLPPLCP